MKKITVFISLSMLLFIPGGVSAQNFPQDGEADVVRFLKSSLKDDLRRKIVFHEPTGLLTITDTPTNHKQIEELLRYYDVPPTQVTIEARFIEIEATDMEELGAELLTSYSKTQGGTSYLLGSGSSSSPGTGTEPAYTGTDFGMSAGGFGNPAEGTGLRLLLGKTMLSGNELQAFLMVLEQTDKATLLSSPKVTTLAGQPANIQIVQRIPYATDVTQNITDLDGDGVNEADELVEIYDVEEQITGITLQVTPTVGEGTDVITLEIEPEVSRITDQIPVSTSATFPAELGRPVVDSRRAVTSVIVKSGETVVMGGLIRDDEITTKTKVPLLGDIPFLGNLFKREQKTQTKRNLVIFITATLITPEGLVAGK